MLYVTTCGGGSMIHDQALGSRRNYINTMDLLPKLMDPEGVRRGMRDGSVHFLSESIDAAVFTALMSPDDGDPVGEY